MLNIGGRYKIGYIHDKHRHNGDVGTITWINSFKYYPNGNIEEYIMKNQIEITFPDGDTIMVVE